jgi:hypothetical protein
LKNAVLPQIMDEGNGLQIQRMLPIYWISTHLELACGSPSMAFGQGLTTPNQTKPAGYKTEWLLIFTCTVISHT